MNSRTSDASLKKRIVIVGGGIAGLEIATRLGNKHKHLGQITLVDSDFAHVWKPMLHTIAAGTRDVTQDQTAYMAQAISAGFIYQPGEMCELDRDNKKIVLSPMYFPDGRELLPQRKIPYDILIMAVGSLANDFGTPGVKEHCYMIDTRLQATAFNREVRARILQCALKGLSLHISIVGGGATGVELAAELIQLANTAESYGTKGLASRIKISIIESGSRLLAAFDEQVSKVTQARLEELGVQVITGHRVVDVKDDHYVLNSGEVVEADLKVWAAGVKGPDFLNGIGGLATNRSNQILVTRTLQSVDDESVFAVGDCSSVTIPGSERPLPPTAQIAHQEAKYLITHLPDYIEHGTEMPPFEAKDMGALVTLGNYGAFGSLGQFGVFSGSFIQGRLAQFSHVMLYHSHRVRLHGFWRGSWFWLVDKINDWLRPTIRLD